jgi:hypothetical protein
MRLCRILYKVFLSSSSRSLEKAKFLAGSMTESV